MKFFDNIDIYGGTIRINDSGSTYGAGKVAVSDANGSISFSSITSLTLTGPYLPLSGGTVTGGTYFSSQLSANSVTTGVVNSQTPGGQIDFFTNDLFLSNDNGGGASSYLDLSNSGIELSSQAGLITFNNSIGNISVQPQSGLSVSLSSIGSVVISSVFTPFDYITSNSIGPCVIINAHNVTVNSAATNSVAAGVSGITLNAPNTFYAPSARLAENGGMVYSAGTNMYDIFGTVKKYSTTLTSPTSGVTNTITHNLGTTDITVALWLVTSNELTAATVSNRTSNTTDVLFDSTLGEDVRVVITG